MIPFLGKITLFLELGNLEIKPTIWAKYLEQNREIQ